MPAERRWSLERFPEELTLWIEREDPADGLVLAAISWIMSRVDDPYSGVRREPAIPNLWFGHVPGAVDENGLVVSCSYWIFERTGIVRCNNVGFLSHPF